MRAGRSGRSTGLSDASSAISDGLDAAAAANLPWNPFISEDLGVVAEGQKR